MTDQGQRWSGRVVRWNRWSYVVMEADPKATTPAK